MKFLAEKKALEILEDLKSDYRTEISDNYEHRAKSCLTCETKGACCNDVHFVNVHISRLEAVAIRNGIAQFPEQHQKEIYRRIDETIDRYDLTSNGDTFGKTYSCPLFEKETGCIVHNIGKPLPCITHACYENSADLPPDELQMEQERSIDDLNRKTYGKTQPAILLPIALKRFKI